MRETFSIIPAPAVTAWFLGGMILLMAAVLLLLGYFGWSSQNVTYEVTPEGLRIRGDIYGRLVPLSSLDMERARLMDLTREPEYRPKWRTNGTGLPGYAAGWFRLANRQKCLAFLTDQRRVVYLPTREGYSLLLTCADGERLLHVLKQRT